MSRKTWAKFICDVCGKEIEADLNPHLDPRFAGWVEYRIHRKYGSACRDAEDDYWDGQGELCPDCMAKTGIKLRAAKA